MKKQRKQLLYLILASVCALFGALLLTVYTAVRFTGFLFCCAGAVAALCGLLDWGSGRSRWCRWGKRGLLLLLAAGLIFFAVLEIRVISWARTDRETPTSAVVVLGAGVNGIEPSLSLLTRLEAALDYVQERPDIPVVVSGSQGPGEAISEARCMADWLIARGVDEDRVILEEQATDTRENIGYSKVLLEERGIDGADGIAVVTSDYHLCRAAYLWEQPNMVPVAAHMPVRYWPITLNYFIREAFALASEIVFR